MFNLLITILIVMIVGYMAYAESKYLFGKPTGCNKNVKITTLPATIASAKSALSKAVTKVKQETQKIKVMLQQKKAANNAPKALDISNPIEHIQASNTLVMGSNAIEDTIDENLPFAKYEGNFKVQKAVNGLIEGVRPPTYADPRTMNPALAAAPVQFSDPAMFGTFGVTDQTSPAFTTKDGITNAAIASERTLEGFALRSEKARSEIEDELVLEEFDVATDVYDANGAVLIMDGKVVKSASELPSAQIMGATPHTTLPMRNLHNPPPVVEDLVEGSTFDGLQGYPVNENLDLLTPAGMATPMAEWSRIMYNV
jgi:hypothetical protein